MSLISVPNLPLRVIGLRSRRSRLIHVSIKLLPQLELMIPHGTPSSSSNRWVKKFSTAEKVPNVCGVAEGQAAAAGWPGVVLVHGGGGTASADCGKQWNTQWPSS